MPRGKGNDSPESGRLQELLRENAVLTAKLRLVEEERATQELVADTNRWLLRRISQELEESLRTIERQHGEALSLAADLRRALEDAARMNERLQEEIERRVQSEAALSRHHQGLERLVAERTAELRQANENLRNLSLKVLTAQENERRWLSMELHDGALQSLAAIHIFLKTEHSNLAERLSDHDFAKLELAVRTVGQIIRDMRAVVENLRPPMLDDIGLEAALRALAEKSLLACPEARLQMHVAVDEDSLGGEQKILCYRILQEALSNVVRHAQARRVTVAVTQGPLGLRLEVEDNGRGFDARNQEGGGAGIESMRERARLMGGHFRLEAAPGKGTRLTVLLPHTAD